MQARQSSTFGLFSEYRFVKAVQVVNLIAAGLLLVENIYNPDASNFAKVTTGVDFLTHALQGLVNENSPEGMVVLAEFLNALRLPVSMGSIPFESSSLGQARLAGDTLLHFVNFFSNSLFESKIDDITFATNSYRPKH